MPQWKNRKIESFNDGILTICSTKGRTVTGTKAAQIRFGNRTIGISRFYKARIESDKIDKLVSIPYTGNLKSSDVIYIDDEQYKINQAQEKFDTVPPCRYLSLEHMVTPYTDERSRNE